MHDHVSAHFVVNNSKYGNSSDCFSLQVSVTVQPLFYIIPIWSKEEKELLIDRAVDIYMTKRRTAVFSEAAIDISEEIDIVSLPKPSSMSENEIDTSSSSDSDEHDY